MNTSFEMNNARKDSDITLANEIKQTSPIVEIFSAVAQGKDTSKFGKKTDVAMTRIKELGENALAGDYRAMAELNTIRKVIVKPLLEAEIQMLGVYGDTKRIGFDESIEVDEYDFVGEKSRGQANNSDVIFPTTKKSKYSVPTQTISGGYAVDYRRIALGDLSLENEGMAQVRTDMINKMKKAIMTNAYNSIKNATPVKYFFEGAGLTKTGVDGVLAKVRRLGGGATVVGDYALLQQFTPWAGYNSEFAYGSDTPRYGYTQGISAEDLKDIRTKGFVGQYAGTPLVEMSNPYDYTTKNSAGDNFNTMIDAGIGLVIPTGVDSPIKNFVKGDITSLSGNDITTGHVLTRFDIELKLLTPHTEMCA